MTVEERLAAVERAVTDDEVEPAALSDAATVERRLDDLETRLDRYEDRLASVEAGVDAVRGHVGDERRSVDDVERTAATALATARRVERRLDGEVDDQHRHRRPPSGLDGGPSGTPERETGESSEVHGGLDWLRRLVSRT